LQLVKYRKKEKSEKDKIEMEMNKINILIKKNHFVAIVWELEKNTTYYYINNNIKILIIILK